MSKLKVRAFGISSMDSVQVQSLENPLGIGGMALHDWAFPTRTFQHLSGKDGGVATIQQFLRAALIDELHIAISPVLLGSGEPLFANIDMLKLGYRCTEHVAGTKATHVVFGKHG